MQEAALSAYRNLGQFHGNALFRTWLTRIAINHALMIRRKRKSGRVVPLTFETDDGELIYDPADRGPNPEQSCYQLEMSRKLRMAIERLSPTLRSAFVLRHVDELTPVQAAEALGVSLPAFKSRLMRARQTLRRRLTYAMEPAARRSLDS
jgi:RNA polymerase sigma-70 factor (ECF subfamily)